MIGSAVKSDRVRKSAGRVLIAEMLVVGGAGLATVLIPETIADWLGRSDVDVARLVGIGLLVYALLLGGHVMKRGASRWSLSLSVAVNIAWVIAAAAALIDVLPGFEGASALLLIAQGALVGLFAMWQVRLIRA